MEITLEYLYRPIITYYHQCRRCLATLELSNSQGFSLAVTLCFERDTNANARNAQRFDRLIITDVFFFISYTILCHFLREL